MTPNGRCVVRVEVLKLPPALTKVLDESTDILGDIIGGKQGQTNSNMEAETSGIVQDENPIEALKKRIMDVRESDIVVSGFQLATAAGLICDEPMWGLAFVIEVCISPLAEQSESNQQSEQYAIFARQVMTAVKDACRAAVLQKKPWLVEAAYFCELTTPTEYLGSMHAVLNRKRARVSKEEMQDGPPLFTVHAYIPEEIEEFGDGSSVLPNTVRKLIDAVRRRKGLHVEEKVVQHATEQRTLAPKV
ncbi:hypothetical protein H0E87_015683 [Populus deltoides]|uniref:Uncharacterized protein n=1 Tax=Populus deltoides TaxID=3696 RepID=A0A8T2Y639_POPDE|nr:hypothetical protein H0E87_015683 [Populus deltoides]